MLDRLAWTFLIDWFALSTSMVTTSSSLLSAGIVARPGYNGIVMRKVQAVYEGGVLRPTGQLQLEEHQLVSVIILDADTDDEEVEFEPPHCFEALANHSISRETVRAALSKIPGSLDADFAAERNER